VISPNLDTTWDIQFLAMLERLGVDAESMTFVPMEDYHGANEMTSGHVDVASSFFSTNEPVAADLDGVAYTSLFYSDYGVVIYANPIFTSQRLIQDQPELIERFVRATLRGYQFAVENPQEAAEMILSYSEGLNLEHETATMVSQIPLIDTGDVPIGWMDADVWQTTQEVLLEQGVIDQAVDLNAVYTNRFVEAAQP
jgi:ABC-type nitrate/sulfonate/bicarbonate transport system substrate-binding protein